ncbi:MAG: arylsulfatase [Ignavibacteriales bacterium]|nr:arylsulfatase [Ignavibacteriales bacterium]
MLYLKTFLVFILLIFLSSCAKDEIRKPNIVLIYVDDLGYGDIGCYGAIGVKTPNLDNLANSGVRFTDSHCAAATCTPSRYSILTGSYAFRNNAQILPGDAPILIGPQTQTLPGMLQKNGYKTAIVGKWHLGLGNGNLDWNKDIKPGPLEVGFDYSFIIPATGDRVPCVYVENHNVVGLEKNDPITVSYLEKVGILPTGLSNPEMLQQQADTQHSNTIINGISRIGYMEGGEKAWWVDEEFPNMLVGKANKFIENNKENPFFLYFSFHDIHVPRVPNKRFVGKSTMGPRGDAIAQMDWCTGEIINKLEELNIDENTLVIFTSDNGPVLNDGYEDMAVELLGEHKQSGPFRGGKYSAYEAGTRIPSIVYWPNVVSKKVSNAIWSQVDLYNSIANLIGYKLANNEAPDSYNMLNTILGKSNEDRSVLLEESFTKGIRKGSWKYISPVSGSVPDWMANKGIESGLSNDEQLYNLDNDIAERNNLAKINIDRLDSLKLQLKLILENEKTRK